MKIAFQKIPASAQAHALTLIVRSVRETLGVENKRTAKEIGKRCKLSSQDNRFSLRIDGEETLAFLSGNEKVIPVSL